MGTRSIVEFQEDGEAMVSVYQQFDGYPESVGMELFNFLTDITIVNGIPMGGPDRGKMANGTGCLAAQFIAEFKTDVGGLYIAGLGQREEYNYLVNVPFGGGEASITVLGYDGEDELFKGTVEGFGDFCKDNS